MRLMRNQLQNFLGYKNNNIFFLTRMKKSTAVVEKQETTSLSEEINDDLINDEVERKRNKSRLKECDRNFLYEKNPYPEPNRWHQGTLKYLRRLYGRYGEASGVNPAICWPVKDELQEKKEYEALLPSVIQMMEDVKQANYLKKEKVRIRQEEIVKKLDKLEEMKQDLENRIRKKETEAKMARDRKERLIEEVRMHFGYTVDPKDEKFKEMLEKKEKEQKKALKEAKQKEREQKMLAKLLTKKADAKKDQETKNS